MFEGNSNAIPIDGFDLDHFGCRLANRLFHPTFHGHVNHLAISARPVQFHLHVVVFRDFNQADVAPVGFEVRPQALEGPFNAFGDVCQFRHQSVFFPNCVSKLAKTARNAAAAGESP